MASAGARIDLQQVTVEKEVLTRDGLLMVLKAKLLHCNV